MEWWRQRVGLLDRRTRDQALDLTTLRNRLRDMTRAIEASKEELARRQQTIERQSMALSALCRTSSTAQHQPQHQGRSKKTVKAEVAQTKAAIQRIQEENSLLLDCINKLTHP